MSLLGQSIFLDLDVSQISIDAVAQTLARSVELEGTDEMLKADPNPVTQVDERAALQDEQVKSVEDEKVVDG